MRRKGATRTQLSTPCSLAAIIAGAGRAGMTPKIALALENKPRIPVVWIHGLNAPVTELYPFLAPSSQST